MSDFDPRTTALVLIDLQNGVVAMPLAPRSGTAVLAESKTLAERFRAAGALVVLVQVGWAADFADGPPQHVDEPFRLPAGGLPDNWATLADGLARPTDIVVTKR